MTTDRRLELLAEGARYDVCLSSCAANARGGAGRVRDAESGGGGWCWPASTPRQGPVGILKVLQTSVCLNRCSYCAFAAQRDLVPRVTLAPDELASAFLSLHRPGGTHGLFLSSAIRGDAESSMTRMVETARLLRRRGFQGYLHLKVLPGVSRGLISEAARWATRLSVNLETATRRSLGELAPDKDFVHDLLLRMKWTSEALGRGLATTHTTQLVVGATPETDLDLLRTVDWVYREMAVFRAYYSAYQPVERGRTVDRASVASLLDREHALYQADYLLRGYGFRLPDLVFDAQGNLPAGVDPKTAYALVHPERYPVDLATAAEEDLLKVPGVGPVTARSVVRARVTACPRDFRELRTLGRVAARAERWLRFPGRPGGETRDGWRQLELLSMDVETRGWSSGMRPLAAEKIGQARYSYPGQVGRRLHYDTRPAESVVRCR